MDFTIRYSPYYTLPFVCLRCRKSWKLRWWPQPSMVAPVDEMRPGFRYSHCPQCQQELIFAGRYFKAPPTSAVSQWRKVELLLKNDWLADGYSSAPRTLKEAQEYLDGCTWRQAALRRELLRRETEKRWRRARSRRVRN